MDDNIKKHILNKLIEFNKSIRFIEDYCIENKINFLDEKMYISLISKRSALKDLMEDSEKG